MTEFIRTLPLHFKSAFRSIKRSFASTLSSVFAVTVTLTLISAFVVVALNLSGFTTNIEKSVEIFVRINPAVSEDTIPALQKQIEDISNVKSVRFSSKEEQFEKFIKDDLGGERYLIFKDDNPLPAAFYVEANNAKYVSEIKTAIEHLEGITDADFGGDSVKDMIKAFDSVRFGGTIFVGILSILAIFLISNTIKINIHNRKEEIAIMRNVGASHWFIKMPFLIEGILIGFLGAFIPILFTIFGYGYLYDFMGGKFFTPMLSMRAPIPFVLQVSSFLVAVGMLVGLFGSFLSVNKYLKWKR